MAIAFNLPSEREANDENFSRLNRLLAELYEVLCHILVSRQPGPEAQESRRERPHSDSEILTRPSTSQPCRLSASSPPLSLTFDTDLEDDVFTAPRSDRNDIFSTRNVDIFGYGSNRTPAGVLLSPRRERSFTFSSSSEKHWRDKGGTDVADGVTDTDETDAISPEDPAQKDSSTSIFSSIIPDKLSGSICTAVLFMLGWKLFSQR
ncbi:uncharacterized protein LOC115455963 [Manduca sexta]|uniref:uncharacterized protein LOC115455963 n=1 Tax=Manduca sexta TaxID=7130 RepID=UPI0011835585|nr:uncharacterized protein LOC115455963 [Manduca sexta]